MNKQQYGEFHKYLAMLIYEYNDMLYSPNLSEASKSEIGEILMALEKVMKICLIDKDKLFIGDTNVKD